MTAESQRLAIAKVCGWEGCSDSKCDYRKAQHLHKGGVVAFPESYSIPRYPDYPNCLNAMSEAEKSKKLNWPKYIDHLTEVTQSHLTAHLVMATASQRAEAFLKCLGLWLP